MKFKTITRVSAVAMAVALVWIFMASSNLAHAVYHNVAPAPYVIFTLYLIFAVISIVLFLAYLIGRRISIIRRMIHMRMKEMDMRNMTIMESALPSTFFDKKEVRNNGRYRHNNSRSYEFDNYRTGQRSKQPRRD